MNGRLRIGSSKGYENANREVLAWNPSTPDELTAHGLHQRFIRWYVCAISYNDQVTWRAPDEPTPGKSIAAVHPDA
jgi:hypothetical protein